MDKAETPRRLQNKHFNEALFCEDFLAAHSMVCVSGSFFTVDSRISDEESTRYKEVMELADVLGHEIYWGPRKGDVCALFHLLSLL